MFRFRRGFASGLRVRAMRRLYRLAWVENTSDARGLRLLRGWLSPEQRAQFNAEGRFDVIGSETGKRYRIGYGTSINVFELDDKGRRKIGWCFVPAGHLVAGDVMLAQKIALETCEAKALAVAQKFPP